MKVVSRDRLIQSLNQIHKSMVRFFMNLQNVKGLKVFQRDSHMITCGKLTKQVLKLSTYVRRIYHYVFVRFYAPLQVDARQGWSRASALQVPDFVSFRSKTCSFKGPFTLLVAFPDFRSSTTPALEVQGLVLSKKDLEQFLKLTIIYLSIQTYSARLLSGLY